MKQSASDGTSPFIFLKRGAPEVQVLRKMTAEQPEGLLPSDESEVLKSRAQRNRLELADAVHPDPLRV